MDDERTKFIILCAARTGSTMLRHLVDSHPEVCCYGEIMAFERTPDRWNSDEEPVDRNETAVVVSLKSAQRERRIKRRWLMELYRDGPRQFLEEFGLYPPWAKAIGFKVKYDELILPDYAWLLEWLRNHREVSVIHLRRENRLKRFISQVTATKVYGVYSITSEEERPATAKLSLTLEECLEDFARTEAREHLFREYFKDHAMLETSYEAVVSNRDNIHGRMAEFLHVAPAVLTTPTLKINPDDVREMLENYDALAAALRDTPYDGFGS